MFHVKHSEDWRQGGFGLYLHWPFCTSKCPYCDFNSHVAARIDQVEWRTAYLSEIARVGAQTPGRILDSVFFGGGTPSLMVPDLVADILDAIQRTWRIANDWEVTLEANPGSVEAGRFAAFRQAGVNRVSMGVQSLRDADLVRLGRRHSVAEARAAFAIARDQFDRVSFDLIYARQDQTLADWKAELAEALAMSVDHLSLYQLTIEDGTPFAALRKTGKLRGLPDEDLAADMYLATQDLCGQAGMVAYEVSNHALPGAESRHNSIYWSAGDFAGIGPGAHGRLTLAQGRVATEALRQPEQWLHAVQKDAQVETVTLLSPDDQGLEYLLMGLRLSEGVDLDRLQAMFGRDLDPTVLGGLIELGKVERTDRRVRATPEGRMVLNAVIAELAAAWT
ncbi:MAG: radical SAM family heme chaperone HemW [Gemmobacter sp.]